MVHNGIITNSRALRALLERKGYTFVSETDTESVAVLIQYIYDQQKLNGEVPPTPLPRPSLRMHDAPGHHNRARTPQKRRTFVLMGPLHLRHLLWPTPALSL